VCTFVTCASLPDLDPDDRLAVDALRSLGARVRAAVWTDPEFEWTAAGTCVIRSTWDYHHRHAEFERWLDRVSATTLLLNPAHAVRWNSHKFYLRDLEARGVPIVPTIWLRRGGAENIATALAERGWTDVVLKPAHGASSDGIVRCAASAAPAAAAAMLLHDDALLQPYLRSIVTAPERALVFIGGAYSHAVTKSPFMHANLDVAARADEPPGAAGEAPVVATGAEIALGERALAAAPPGNVYARVDMARDDDGRLRVMEVELIEPTLYLFARRGAALDLARAILAAGVPTIPL
jgi:glutathione synthase/RimK-type ligase-like ATP-grasp enzyme